jgi:uncharacterized protein
LSRPAPSAHRLETLDVLRGFALLGILAMNVRIMAGPLGAYMYPFGLFEYTGLNRAAYVFTNTFFDLKMMGLFSMLFGVSVLLYAAKPAASIASLRALWFRRMFWLLLIGLVHAYLIWNGDILVPYALCGMLVLWWVRRLSPRLLLALSAVMLLVGAGLAIAHGAAWDAMTLEERAQEAAMVMPSEAQLRSQLDSMLGSYTGVVLHRAPYTFGFQTVIFAAFFFWRCSGMMLLGMALYKWGVLDGRREPATYARLAATCLPLGVGLSWWGAMELERAAYAMPSRAVLDLWNYTGAVFLSVGYAAALILLIKRDVLRRLRRALAAVGQLALSNYLLHSVLSSILFLGWGFGLGGRLDYAEQLLYVAVVWAAQLLISPIWLAHFRFGPAEWLWRSLTYWKVQPMRRGSTPAVGDIVAPA